jgi:hypothetical protein
MVSDRLMDKRKKRFYRILDNRGMSKKYGHNWPGYHEVRIMSIVVRYMMHIYMTRTYNNQK